MNTDQLSRELKSDEGWVPHAYQDHLGFWTLGYGFLVDERKNGRIPEKVADYWLRHEIMERWSQLVARRPWIVHLPDDVQRALGNMAYQLGVNGVLNFRKMLAALESGDRDSAADEALSSRWATQTPKRARRVSALIRGEETQ